jgi:hypothetical protein
MRQARPEQLGLLRHRGKNGNMYGDYVAISLLHVTGYGLMMAIKLKHNDLMYI